MTGGATQLLLMFAKTCSMLLTHLVTTVKKWRT
jgi:hypothetical protein